MIAVTLLLVTCRAATPHGGSAITWEVPVEIARGGGTKGPWQQNDSNFDYVDDPSVALAADGSPALVWVDHRDKDVHFRRGTRTVNVSRSPAIFSWLPRVALANDHVYVIWQEIVFSGGTHGGEIFFARSTDRGATFADPVNLSKSVNGDGKGRIDAKIWHNGSLDLAVAPDGTLYAAWTEYDGPLWFTRSTDAGETFAAPRQVAGTAALPARAPSLAVAGDGTVYLAWTHGEHAAADIHVAMLHGDAFGEPVVVATTPNYSDAPKLAVDRAGTLHVVFAETSGGPFAPPRIHYTRSRDRAKHFEPALAISPQHAGFPALAVDGDRIFVLCEVLDDGRGRGLALATSPDGGTRFAWQPVPHSRDRGWNGSQQGQLMNKLAVRDGRIAIVNSSLRPDESSRVWLIRGHL
ncbi:MAG: exo-alpha-sialidase [Deltaproteobacteria bacterium]|nr:exo-alpha-sialidase [Deltaproteobacteria bacterium]MDQ3297186.1 glycoside hydrolase [Myxococcota bacterium]